jgi:tRNA pseudouridine32 synthase / 23S rRNA pseudouridine746 synthase
LQKLPAPLPFKQGVPPNKIWLPPGDWKTIFEFFQRRFPQLDQQSCYQRFQSGEVRLDCGQVVESHTPYQANRHLFFYHEVANEISVPFEHQIIFQDENIIVADKPHFLPVAPSGNYLQHTLLVRLRRQLNNDQIQLCHRIDRETAGLVLLTKKESVRAAYHSLFSERKIQKLYWAKAATVSLDFPFTKYSRLVKGKPFMRMKEVDGEPNSQTWISIEQSNNQQSIYQLSPHTGKKHQLRVHMASLGAPIVNDCLYPNMIEKGPHDFTHPLQLLAKQLQFVDPLSGTNQCFKSELTIHLD